MDKWEELKKRVEEHGDVLTVSMNDLKNAAGKARLGVKVNKDISRALAGIGIGHVPLDLPLSQDDLIRLYKKGSDIGELIETVLTPGDHKDKLLRENTVNSSTEYFDMVAKIRAIVAE